mmetsp:Transcript_1129/g.2258  ORF Transcript_1129/g.2258 Transcript_1129/m.2258 type:complete len:211 (+) Transcript_1129:151-783(+)
MRPLATPSAAVPQAPATEPPGQSLQIHPFLLFYHLCHSPSFDRLLCHPFFHPFGQNLDSAPVGPCRRSCPFRRARPGRRAARGPCHQSYRNFHRNLEAGSHHHTCHEIQGHSWVHLALHAVVEVGLLFHHSRSPHILVDSSQADNQLDSLQGVDSHTLPVEGSSHHCLHSQVGHQNPQAPLHMACHLAPLCLGVEVVEVVVVGPWPRASR